MHYRTVADLNNDILEWSRRLPDEIDLVVGIPRSGLLVANLLALAMNVPFTDVEGLVAGRLLSGGDRLGRNNLLSQDDRVLRILVVDDSVWSGGQMARARTRIAEAHLRHHIAYGAVYVVPDGACLVDTYHSKVPVPRAFEWNILHHPALAKSCVSLEGTILPATQSQPTDAVRLRRVRPQFRPTQNIGCLVALQPEASRPALTAWLGEHGIRHDTLALITPPTVSGRSEDDVLREKTALYRSSRAWIYIEASGGAAARLARSARRPVYCFETREMLYPGRAGGTETRPLPETRVAMRLRDLADRIHGKIRVLAQ